MLKRKEFIQKIAGLTGATLLGGLITNYAESEPRRVDKLVIDLHCHPATFFTKGTDRYQGDDKFHMTIDSMNTYAVSAAFFSIVSDRPVLAITENGIISSRPFNYGEAWQEYSNQLTILKELIEKASTQIAVRFNDLSKNKNVSVLLACEGADFLEGSLDRLDEVYTDGVRSIQLVHYTTNDVGDLQTARPIHQGLSDYGKKLVKKMNEQGMLIDVAHASFKTAQDVAEASSSPIMLSHSILQNGSNGPVSNRAISVDHAKIIAQTGGIIGAWPSGFSTSLNNFVDNTLRLVDAAGIDHVGLGTDMDANYKPVIKNYSEVITWIDALQERGLSREEVRKLAGDNAARVLKQILKK